MKATSSGTRRWTPRWSTEHTPRVSPGVSVFRGIEGFGRGSAIHTNRLLDVTGDLSVTVGIVDEATRVRALLDGATESWQTGLVTVEDVTVVGPPGGDRPV